MAKRNWTVSPAIADHYKVVNTDSPLLHSKIGDVDLRKITLEQADKMYGKGTRYLEKIKVKRIKEKPAN